jgi:hypothetical protein
MILSQYHIFELDTINIYSVGPNPGPLQLVHWQSDALTTRLDLIRTRLDLIRTTLDLIRTRLDLIRTRLDLIKIMFLINFVQKRTQKCPTRPLT